MSENKCLSKVALFSNRFDIIRFVKNACEPAVSVSVFHSISDISFVETDLTIIILDASLIYEQERNYFSYQKFVLTRIICLSPMDAPDCIRLYTENQFHYVIPFPISMEQFRVMILRFQNLMNNKAPADIPLLADNDVVPESFFGYFCGCSEAIRSVRKSLLKVSCTKEPVLLLGETGTGKTTAANVIHALSENKRKKLVSLPLSTVVGPLAGSTFFGHAKGSFTSAECESKGIFEVADGSTLFLDELGVASLELQAMLLTVLETGDYKKVGTGNVQHCDVRLIFATNADLNKMLKEGTFRPDLYFRICDNIIRLPPIRERKEDICDIVDNFIKKQSFSITKGALERLEAYSWPGNIRELHKCLMRAMSNNETHIITDGNIDFGEVSFLQ